MFFRFLKGMALLVVVGAAYWAASFAPSHVARGEGESADRAAPVHHHYYFKEMRALTLDVTRVAVLDRGGDAAGLPQLEAYGLDDGDVAPMLVSGWHLASTRPEKQTAEGVAEIVARIRDDRVVDFVSPVFAGLDGGPVIITPHILVGFDRKIDAAGAEAVLGEVGAGVILERDWANMPRAYKLQSAARSGFEMLEAANRLAQRPEVMFAEPDFLFTGRGSFVPNDTFFDDLWGLHNTGQDGGLVDFDMDGPEAWDNTTGDSSIIVLVLDTGVQLNHPDLNLHPTGIDTTSDAGDGGPFNACDNHGTAVAGCVSAIINNNLGVVGICPDCRTASARPFISSLACDGSWSSSASWTVDALAWGESIGVRVTNNSNSYGFTSAAIETKYNDMRNNGVVHFASAGNDASATIAYPASLSTVNALAASDRFGNRAGFSNWGVGLAFTAPGAVIGSTDRTGTDGYVGGDYVLVNGTSFSSPYSAGVAGLILSVDASLNAVQVEGIMQQSAVDMGPAGYDTDFGWGHVNAKNALDLVKAIEKEPKFSQPPEGEGEDVASNIDWTSPEGLPGSATLEVTARDDVPGPVDIVVDAKDSGDGILTSQTLTWAANDNGFSVQSMGLPAGTATLRLTFVNDFCGAGCPGDPDADRNAFIDFFTVDGRQREGEKFDRTGGTDPQFPGCGPTIVDGRSVVSCGNENDFVEYDIAVNVVVSDDFVSDGRPITGVRWWGSLLGEVTGPVCGNNVREDPEECDGTDDAACPGECLADCTCPDVCLLVNEDFESGSLSGWTKINIGSGSWVINDGNFIPASGDGPLPPCGGDFSAVTDQTGPGVHTLYQDVTIPATATTAVLNWTDMIRNHAGTFSDPNQEFRVEIWDPADNSVLTSLFSTKPGDELLQNCTARCADVSALIGQTVRVAFTEEDNLSFFNVHLDDVCIELDVTPPSCGNNVRECVEECDGTDDAACPGECQADCTCPPPPSPCGPDAGDCCVNNGTPGCDEPECCESVCAIDPFCCTDSWDDICADEAAEFCAGLCPALASGPLEPRAAERAPREMALHTDLLAAEQQDTGAHKLRATVYAVDDKGKSRDHRTREVLDDLSSEALGGVCGPGAGDCCVDNGTPGCDDVDCCELVCSFDPFCCDEFWDDICAEHAADSCGDLCGELSDPDGWFVSFHEPKSIGGDQQPPLALYFCDALVVQQSPTALPSCDGHPVIEYEVQLADCCLIHANVDSRSGTVPASKEAFFEEQCFEYALDIQAVVGHRFVQDPDTLECIEVPTGRTAVGDFWGWHTTDFACGLGGPDPLQPALQTTVTMAGEDWLYGPWEPVDPVCSQPNMAFELLTTTPPDPDHADNDGDCVPDKCVCKVANAATTDQLPQFPGGPLVDSRKNRFLTISTGDEFSQNRGRSHAIRVIIESLPSPYDGLPEVELWVGVPTGSGSDVERLSSRANKGLSDPIPPDDARFLRVAQLRCGPPSPGDPDFYRDWTNLHSCRGGQAGTCEDNVCVGGPLFGESCSSASDCTYNARSCGDDPGAQITAQECIIAGGECERDEFVHLYHPLIIPDGFYRAAVIDESCDPTLAGDFSPRLDLDTSRFGDLAGGTNCSPPAENTWCAPDGNTVVGDVVAAIDTFGNKPIGPIKARAEAAGLGVSPVDGIIGVSDLVIWVDAVLGKPMTATPMAPDNEPPCP